MAVKTDPSEEAEFPFLLIKFHLVSYGKEKAQTEAHFNRHNMMPSFYFKLPQWKWPIRGSARGIYTYLSADQTSTDQDSGESLLEKAGPCIGGKCCHRPFYRDARFLVAHFAIFSIYVFILLLVGHSAQNLRYHGLPYSPARGYITFQETSFSLEDRIQDHASPFTGKPSEEVDQAWHDLLNDENILLEPEYIRHYNREDSSVEVPEHGHYLGTLNVYHELHCLKRIRQYMYMDYYFPSISEHQKEINRLHNEHCIDFLRQSAMCHGDIGLITYSWHADQLMPIANATSHQCVDWNKLSHFTRSRSVDMMRPNWLRHPTKGVAYPDGEGDNIGAAESPHLDNGHGHGH
ncbi:hypothetical protein F5B22DRAFT_628018 [Xylaria bambusicola]|uniref:uncharacterized protein n=1 Tax=Xylaria bambusicola TaxID=326684 RepID=UPI0020075F9F|nr:uncharacterized protein F5B22DRAFT_628018 [Xylaria bambusicola]KAI0505384.1 hypothetical protein F5B22DRAFT_628018 [Xylaria bambusicola]